MAITSPKKTDELLMQFKINPEINVRLETFMKSEPGLVEFVKQLPREQLERKFLLRKMQDQQQKELLKSIQAMISPVMRPERQEQAVMTQAKNFIRNTGIKLS